MSFAFPLIILLVYEESIFEIRFMEGFSRIPSKPKAIELLDNCPEEIYEKIIRERISKLNYL